MHSPRALMSADSTPAEPEAKATAGPSVARRLIRWLIVLAVVLYFAAGLLFVSVRYLVLPNVGTWRSAIAEQASSAVGAPVRIGAIHADWDGFRPRLHLRQVDVLDGRGEVALGLDRVDATIAWSSLIRFRPYFDRLELFQPDLALSRSADGSISVAGIRATGASGGSDGFEWLLHQRQIVVRDARLSWEDALRNAPALVLDNVNIRLSQHFRGHHLGVTARSGSGVFESVDLRADLNFGSSARFAEVTGQSYARIEATSIEALAPWVDVPMSLRGRGDVALWFDWQAGTPERLRTRFSLADAGIQFDPVRPALSLVNASGTLAITRRSDGFSIETEALALQTAAGVVMPATDASLVWRATGAEQSAQLKVNALDLKVLSVLAETLPMTEDQASALTAMSPAGRFVDLEAAWSQQDGRTTGWKVNSAFDGLSVEASPRWPGVAGISGRIEGDQDTGRYFVSSENVALALPGVFLDALSFDRLMAEGGWGQEGERLRVSISNSSFDNADLKGEASGHYFLVPGEAGEIDLQARLSEANGAAVWRYLPLVVNDHTRDWLKRGIVRGTARDARLRLKGPLSRFPFRQPDEGIFLITAQVTDALLDYAPDWPQIDAIEGGLRFDGPRMTITASRGVISGVNLSGVVADVPDLANGDEAMTITGKADGATQDFLAFVAASPVSQRINGFTDGIEAQGKGHLDLRLDMPLRHVKDTAVRGQFSFRDNRLRLLDGLPWMENAAGAVGFTGQSLTIEKASASALGGAVQVSAKTGQDGTVVFSASGEAQARAIADLYAFPALTFLSGATPWTLEARVGKGASTLEVSSTLEGLGSSLPAPLNKSARDAWPTSVALRFVPGEPVALEAHLADRASATLSIPRGGQGVVSGGVGVGGPARNASEGVMLAWKQDEINLDRWRELLDGEATASSALPIAGVSVVADVLRVRNRDFHDVNLRAENQLGQWQAEVRSREAEGTISWLPEAEGRLVARLSRLTLGKAASDTPAAVQSKSAESFPALDVTAEKFGVNGLDLGRLKLNAFNRGGVWHMNALSIDAGQSQLTASGLWAASGDGRTQMDFTLTTEDVGKLLARLDYPDAVQRGTATLTGTLSWRGGPAELDYPSMDGAFELLAEAGQFRKLDPGVGRLLGVLSLQSLPRRITLDFRDVFSEGFAFDRISGSIEMNRGVVSTDSMQIRGPAASIVLSGQASVPDETQDLHVAVQPTLSESVAVGAALGGAVINPVAGVVTYIVQKALEDPVEKFFAFEYEVTGTWKDPVVKKLGKKESATPPTDGPAGQIGPLN